MKATVTVSLVGVLGFDEEGRLIDKTFFKKDPKIIAEKLNLASSGKAIEEAISLVKKMKKKGYTVFLFDTAELAEMVEKELKVEVCVYHSSRAKPTAILREKIEKIAVETGFVKQQNLRELERQVSVELTKLRVKKAGEKRDLMVAQAILSIGDLDKTINLFLGRIREWYGLHFPELDGAIMKHETYAKLVLKLGKRLNFTAENLGMEGLQTNKAAQVWKYAENSMGAELTDADIEQIQNLSKHTLGLYRLRETLQGFADSVVEDVAPNLRALVGSLLAARLIALAGGLTNLAKMPASKIQVLGAEKALFRALKTGAKPPKHGIIFHDVAIHDAKKSLRGKMSRALAGKIAIAARADAFSTRYIGDMLKRDLEKRLQRIREKYRKLPSSKKHSRKKLQGQAHVQRGKRGKKRGFNR